MNDLETFLGLRFQLHRHDFHVCFSLCHFHTKQWPDNFRNEYLTMAIVYERVGKKKEADEFLKKFKGYMDKDETIYKNLQLGMYNAHRGDTKRSLEHLKLFSKEDNFVYWALLLREDPIVENMKDNPDFTKVANDMR
jgi:hypothetical protein